MEIDTGAYTKRVQLNRIHIEEDAGKSIHDIDDRYSLIDLNRAGTPLLEIVTEPDLFSSDEAWHFLNELRKTVRYLDVCDGNMEEGSMRCDANISVRLKGEKKLGTKVEVKNLNSLRFLKKAIEMEIQRQVEELEAGNEITQHTRGYDAEKDTTFAMRYKEEADDYRYFPEPDLPPVKITDALVKEVKGKMPELPGSLLKRFKDQYGLPDGEARILTEEKEFAMYFEGLATNTGDAKVSANWMLGTVKSYMNQHSAGIRNFPVKVERLSELITLISSGTVSHSAGATAIFDEMTHNHDESPESIARRLNLIQESDVSQIIQFIEEVLESNPDKMKAYFNGKKGLTGFFMGEVMKLSGGKLDPKLTSKLLLETLNKKKQA